jgi:hypothetical protein
VEFHLECEAWAEQLSQADAEALLAAVRVLRSEGPNLGRPLVDTVKASRHPNMKEFRPGSTGRSEIRVLFAFDKQRRAVLLVGGDKSHDWDDWYRASVALADERFEAHQASITERREANKKPARTQRTEKGKRQ